MSSDNDNYYPAVQKTKFYWSVQEVVYIYLKMGKTISTHLENYHM